jgi:hypothetical protein
MADAKNIAQDKRVRAEKEAARTNKDDSPAVVDGDGHYRTPEDPRLSGQPGRKPRAEEIDEEEE